MDHGACSSRRFLNGDEGAFDEIMSTYFDHLVFFINRYVNNYHTAEDIAIDVFSDLIVHRHRYNFKVTLKTYLFMIARSRALNYIKRGKILIISEIQESDLASDGDELEENILNDDRKRRLHRAMNELNEEMRCAIHLVYFEEMTYEEAARAMKKTAKQIDNLLYRAKKALYIILERDGELI